MSQRNLVKLSEEALGNLYLAKKHSVSEISKLFHCSEQKTNYWILKYKIPKRSISDAIYAKRNPQGDPFTFQPPASIPNAILFGVGLGLYWGEGTKRNRHAIRLGNTDPKLIKAFMIYLRKTFLINETKLRFGLQIFSDMSPKTALSFWVKELGVRRAQFQKVIVTPARSLGTYRQKTKHGVLTVYYHNKKLRDIVCKLIEEYKPE